MAALNARRVSFGRVCAVGSALALITIGIAPASAMPGGANAGQSAARVPGDAGSLTRWRPHVEEASRRFGIPISWIEQVMMAESGGRTEIHGRAIVSSAGAMGLMQIMPGTWAEMRRRLGLGGDPHAPRDNILAGTLYLRLMYDRFGYPGLFGAYNAGPARYTAYLRGRQSLPAETRNYLVKLAGAVPRAGHADVAATIALPTAGSSANSSPGDLAQSLFFIRRPVPARSEACGTAQGRASDASC